MAEIKGILLNAWLDFLRARNGKESVSEALNKLGVEDRVLFSSPFLASSWYPYSTLHALRRLTRLLASPAERNLSEKIGRFMAEYVFSGVYRSLLVKDPIKQVEKFSWIGDFFFHEARRLDTEVTGESRCLVRYRYEAGARPTRSICESLAGFWARTIEMAGASNVVSSHPRCVTAGSDCCEFVFEWRAAHSGSG